MADDNVLKIGVEFDVAPIVSATREAVTANKTLGTSVADLAARFKEQGLSETETLSALKNLGYSEAEATAAIRASATASSAASSEVAALRAQVDELRAALTRLEEQSHRSAGGIDGVRNAMGKARAEAGAITGSTGMIVGGFARLAAQSAVLAPLIELAFPILGALAFLEILDHVDTAMHNAMESAMGFGEAEKKALDKAREANLQNIGIVIEQTNEIRKQSEIGVEGTEKHVKAISDLKSEQTDYAAAARESLKQLQDLQAQLKELTSFKEKALVFAISLGDMTQLNEDAANIQKQIDNVSKHYEEMIGKIKPIGIEVSAQQKESAVEAEKEAREMAEAQNSAAKTAGTARIALQEEIDREMLARHEITFEEFRTRSEREENEKFTIESNALARRKTLLEQEHKETGRNVAPELVSVQAQEEALESEHAAKLSRIRATADEQIRRRDEERAITAVDAAQKEIEAADRAGEAYSRLVLAHADTPKEVETAEVDLQSRITKTYNDQITAIKSKADILEKTDAVANEKQIAELRAQAIALDADRESAVRSLQEEASEKIKTMHRQEVGDQIAAMNEQVSIVTEGTRNQEEENRRLFSAKRETLTTFTREAISAAEEEFSKKHAIYEQEITAVKQAVEAQILTEEQGKKRLDSIYAEEAKAVQELAAKEKKAREESQAAAQRYFDRVTEMTNRSLLGWINGQERFSVAMSKLWAEVADNAIMNIMKMIEQEAVAALTHNAIAKSQIAHDAGTAAASAFRWVMTDVPFPLNAILAPVAAAAAFAGVMAFGAFEKGGIVQGRSGEAVPILAHAEEMVLPAGLSSFIQDAAKGNTATAGPAGSVAMAASGGTMAAIGPSERASASFPGVSDRLSAAPNFVPAGAATFAPTISLSPAAAISALSASPAVARGAIAPAVGSSATEPPGAAEGLKESISSIVSNTARSETNTIRRGDTNVHIHHNGTNLSHADIVRAVRTAVRRGELTH